MTKIISEIGVNWSGDIMTARDMIIQSSRAGADYVKFQLFNSETIKESKYEYELSQMLLNKVFIQYLSDISKENKIGFGISVMYKEGFDLLDKLNNHSIQFVKIRFADKDNSEIAERAVQYCKENKVELIISCDDLNKASSIYRIYDYTNYLYCVPKYPPELSEIDISKFDYIDGYSNHFPSKYLPMIAVTKKLEFIEIHVKRKTHNSIAISEGIILPQLDENVSIDFDDLEDVCKFRDIVKEINMR